MTLEPIKDVNENTFASDVIERSKEKIVIVDFWAPWCAPCKAIGPVLESVAQEREILVAKVDTEQNTSTAAQLGVRSIPALFMYRNGSIVSQKTGSMPKAKLLSWIDEVMTADDF